MGLRVPNLVSMRDFSGTAAAQSCHGFAAIPNQGSFVVPSALSFPEAQAASRAHALVSATADLDDRDLEVTLD